MMMGSEEPVVLYDDGVHIERRRRRPIVVEYDDADDPKPAKLFDPWDAYAKYLPLGIVGFHRFHNDPALAYAYATSFGLCGVGFVFDFFFIPFSCTRPDKAFFIWKLVRLCYSLVYAFLMSTLAGAVGPVVFPYIPRVVFTTTASVAALFVTRDFGTYLSVFLGVVFPYIYVFRAVEDRSVYRDFQNANPFFLIWFIALVKFLVSLVVCVDTNFIAIAPMWKKPNKEELGRFYERNTAAYYRFAGSCLVVEILCFFIYFIMNPKAGIRSTGTALAREFAYGLRL